MPLVKRRVAELLQQTLSARDLACTRAGRPVFSGLTFSAQAGEVWLLRGANGSGKSSLLRLLCGLLPPASGQVNWQGRSIVAQRTDFSRQVAYLGHADGLRGELTVQENLHFSLHLAGSRPDAIACRAVLTHLRLAGKEHAQARHLSQGQRRRLALARVLLSQRALWLLDEPHAGLDTQGEQLVDDCLAEHARNGGLAVVATHRARGDAAQTLDLDELNDAPRSLPDHRP
jgi:heme exporter protein A